MSGVASLSPVAPKPAHMPVAPVYDIDSLRLHWDA